MKKTLVALSVLAAMAGAMPAYAQSTPEHSFAFNLGAVSDYRYRGISQSRFQPALQGGVDYGHSSGLYAGLWASTIKWIKDADGDADVEVDLYAGYKGSLTGDFGYDVGVLRYQYPGHRLDVSPNTTEIYGAVSYGPATLKYSHSVTNLFGWEDSKNSNYIDLSATFDVAGFAVTPHIGYQKVRGNSDASYTDYSVTVSKDIAGFLVSAAIVGTDTKKPDGEYAYPSPSGKNLGRTALVVGVKYNF
ncbi:MAG TPA: TorF family putative porin [Burkholderiaceae bacterium]|nr:TorF family putative porin [Burkholderiaceae bacterium]